MISSCSSATGDTGESEEACASCLARSSNDRGDSIGACGASSFVPALAGVPDRLPSAELSSFRLLPKASDNLALILRRLDSCWRRALYCLNASIRSSGVACSIRLRFSGSSKRLEKRRDCLPLASLGWRLALIGSPEPGWGTESGAVCVLEPSAFASSAEGLFGSLGSVAVGGRRSMRLFHVVSTGSCRKRHQSVELAIGKLTRVGMCQKH